MANASAEELLRQAEQEQDLELQLLLEQHTFTQYYMIELNRFLLEHKDYFLDKLAQSKSAQHIFTAIQLKDPDLLTEEERLILPKMERLLQMHADGEQMEFRHEELLDLEDSKPKQIPGWVQRNPKLHARVKEVYKMLDENTLQFTDSIFFPDPPADFKPNRIEEELEKVENRQIGEVVRDYDRELLERARLGDLPDPDSVHKDEAYVKKARVLGEVLNRISDQVQTEFEEQRSGLKGVSEGGSAE